MADPILIVGAGVAGQCAARKLIQAGREVIIFDSDDRPGGRLKTDQFHGFRLDRGFQVYFTAYPHAKHELDYDKLELRIFEPGAMVFDGKDLHEFHRDKAVKSAFSPLFGPLDKLAMLQWNSDVASRRPEHFWGIKDVSTEAHLRSIGFSDQALDRFVRPFWGGVFLDRSLSFSVRPFAYYWKMMLEGDIVIPRLGMEEISNVLELGIPIESFHMGQTAQQVLHEGGKVTGLRMADGREVKSDTVIIATEADRASQLAMVDLDVRYRSSTTIYFHAPEPPSQRPIIHLNASGKGTVNHVVPMSQVSKSLAPAGEHLVSVTILGLDPRDDQTLANDVKAELAAWFPDGRPEKWRALKVYRVRFAQMNQSPGYRERLPSYQTPIHGLYLAGEFTEYSSIDGAVLSGNRCAATILNS